MVELAPPGELPWKFRYGTGGARSEVGAGDLVDRSSGRLYDVSRASLAPGTTDQVGPDTTSTVVYAVPLTRAAGGPHDLDPDALATWAQGNAPTDATAIFGPEDVPGLTTATPSAPGADGYRAAVVHYLDASGREVNTAAPAGPDAPAAGYVDTAEYDEHGNVVRSLSAGNRLLALGQVPTAAADLAVLGLTGPDTAIRARALSSYSTFDSEGLDVLRVRGPLVSVSIGNDPNDVQKGHALTTFAYDEGKPDGAAYHLVTTQTDALLIAGSNPEQLVDVTVTKNGYDPIDGASPTGATSGWKIGSPTSVTVDAGGANLTSRVRYDDQGRSVESRHVGATGTDARTIRFAYYTPGAHPERAECASKPAWAGLPCTTWAARSVTGHDPARMAGALPVTTVTDYTRHGAPESVTESATGPVDGAIATQTRIGTTVFDAAGRPLSSAATTTGPGVSAAPMPITEVGYDPATGRATSVSSVDPSDGTSVLSTISKVFDDLGRMTRYTDADGGWTAYRFDEHGKPTQLADSLGATRTVTYDRAVEPRGFPTAVTDSVAGTFTASYGPDGELLESTLPGGLALRIGYDANRSPVLREYVRAADDAVVASSAIVENAAGQWLAHTTDASAKEFGYDDLGRLTDVRDTVAGACTWRRYGHNERAGRTSMDTVFSSTAVCADPGAPGAATVGSVGYDYDSADRLVADTAGGAGRVYDPLGRMVSAPASAGPGVTVEAEFFATDMIATQTIAGLARQTFALDPAGRFRSSTAHTWSGAAWAPAATTVNHYGSDGDSPSWVVEDDGVPGAVTRYVAGVEGGLAVQTGAAGERLLQLTDLRGNVMGTLPIADGATEADWAALAYRAADEFGNPTDLGTGTRAIADGRAPGKAGRYGWLGADQRSADALGGVLLMGVRLYDPATGRFQSVDSIRGGNATEYDYCAADPVNCTDLTGRYMTVGLNDRGPRSGTVRSPWPKAKSKPISNKPFETKKHNPSWRRVPPSPVMSGPPVPSTGPAPRRGGEGEFGIPEDNWTTGTAFSFCRGGCLSVEFLSDTSGSTAVAVKGGVGIGGGAEGTVRRGSLGGSGWDWGSQCGWGYIGYNSDIAISFQSFSARIECSITGGFQLAW